MPAATLNWRRLAPVTLSANTINAALDALWTAGTAATYADGTARTPGTNSAWTWSRDTTNALQPGATTAAYALPPTSGTAPSPGTVLPQAIIWAGSTSAPTLTQQYVYGGTDAKTASMLYAGQCKNPGAYSNWNSATPFTTGQFTGFATAFVAPATATWNALYMWESQEAVIVQFARTSPQVATSWSGAGALLDPGITAAGETDGRLYGVFTSGSNNYCSSIMWSATSDTSFNESGVANNCRFGCFVPGTSTVAGYFRLGTYTPANTFLARGGEVPLVPVYAQGVSGNTAVSPGRLREIFLSRDGLTGQTLSNGGPALGYVAGSQFITTAADAAVLTP